MDAINENPCKTHLFKTVRTKFYQKKGLSFELGRSFSI